LAVVRRLLCHLAVREPQQICILLVAVVGCATSNPHEITPLFESSKADGAGFRLALVDQHRVDVAEPSDLVIADGRLYTVSDRHPNIYRISRKGNVKDVIEVGGTDLEALAVHPVTKQFAIGDERDDKIWFVDAQGNRDSYFEIDGIADRNSGIEGLAFDDRGHLFVAKEKRPARIYELDPTGVELARTDIRFASDLSALAWNRIDGRLYALSDVDRALYRLDKHLEADVAWRLPIENPEGIAFDGTTLYVISDAEARLYQFAIIE
jgi:uncharacterized protein YjiK